ncbi:MAG: hypothetical protein V7719_12660 [Psychroserpens sp.]|uniref:hypothetical protein n=1 Tax=Psychroserpens sp. TaxID=2020870 RepID=UPI003002B67A
MLNSCRKDEFRFEETPTEDPLEQNSLVANLMQRTALNDGSDDNIIDRASCITVQLPVNLVVNGLPIIINDEDDYDTIEAIFDESDSDTDTLVIIFPISIILENHTEVIVNNENELNDFRDDCSEENEDDEDIECIDFNYPISFTTYNTLIDELDSESITSDMELYEFIDAIEDYLVININFPLTLSLYDGTSLNVSNLNDLESAIEDVIDDCDEDDDFDFDEDDNVSLSEQEFIDLLVLCSWEIDELEVDEQDLEDQFDDFRFVFNADGTTVATNAGGTDFNGTWMLSTSNGLRLTIQFDDFPSISNTWRLHEISTEDDGTRLDLRNIEDHIKLQQDCS